MPSVRLRALRPEDAPAVLRIFNHYVEHSFAAYPGKPVTEDAIHRLMMPSGGYPSVAAETDRGEVVGFGLLRAYSPHDTFADTALLTTFIAPEWTHQGLGGEMLRRLEAEAMTTGIRKLLAHVSSENPASLAFHRKHGFTPCGTFHGIGRKHGITFDVVWFEKELDSEPG